MDFLKDISPFQILTLVFCIVMVARAFSQYRRHGRSKRELAAWVAVWGIVAFIAAYPRFSDWLGTVLGLKSGASAIFLFAIIILTYITLRHIFMIESLEEEITVLTRRLTVEKFKSEHEHADGK